jgi:hypothetical protein
LLKVGSSSPGCATNRKACCFSTCACADCAAGQARAADSISKANLRISRRRRKGAYFTIDWYTRLRIWMR